MSDKRKEIFDRILSERERHFNLPGSEWDMKNNPNDWIAIITSCLSEETRRFDRVGEAKNFENSLLKSAAVIVAALEMIDVMIANKTLT